MHAAPAAWPPSASYARDVLSNVIQWGGAPCGDGKRCPQTAMCWCRLSTGVHFPIGVLSLLTLLTSFVALGCGSTAPDVGRTGEARRLGLGKHGRRAGMLPTCMLLRCKAASISKTSDLAGRNGLLVCSCFSCG